MHRHRKIIAAGIVLLITNIIGTTGMAETKSGKKWAIAVHGGAGGDPAKWSEDKRTGRIAGLQRALNNGKQMLLKEADAIDVVESVIKIFEDDAYFNAGRGAVLTTDKKAELDASIMDGRTLACGAVAGVTTTKNPITLARLVMAETPHVLLAGPGADMFSREQDVPQVEPSYFLSWQKQKPAPAAIDGQDEEPHYGTVGCVVLDTNGNLAAGTSTGGTSKKLPGRVGDSPIVGAGTYAANDTCAISGTGIGEEYIRHAVAYDVVAQMRYANRSAEVAVKRVMEETLEQGDGGIIVVDKDGNIALAHNTPGMNCGAADSSGRFEVLLINR